MLLIVLPSTGYNYTSNEIEAIRSWVADGGSLLVAGENQNLLPNENAIINDLIAPYDIIINMGSSSTTTYLTFKPHPITEEVASLYHASNGYINITGSAYPIWFDASYSNIVVAGNDYGNGRVIVTTDINWFDDTYISNANNQQFNINIANWLTAAKADVLVYTDWGVSANYYVTPVILALNDLGIKHHLTSDFYYFNLTLHEKSWYMVIISNPSMTGLSTYFDDVIEYIDSGGHLILSTYIMDNYQTHPIWARLGTAFHSDYTSNPDLYIWELDHYIFTQPHFYSQNKFVIGTAYTDDGDTVTVLPNATALAGFTSIETAGESFITLRNDEQTLFNSYLIDEFTNDFDNSTYEDNYELWKNEIAFMMRPKLEFAITVPLENYVGKTVSLTAEITNIGLSNCPIGYLELFLVPNLSTTDNLEQNYSVLVGATEIVTWAVKSSVVQNVTVQFEGLYTGFLGTSYDVSIMYFDIHFLEQPPGIDLPWYYYVVAGGVLLLIIVIIIVATRIKKKIATR
ncbi:MAG: hypothetical protein JXA54_09665 [Candidatus Heimdallarchaeota archaeon]|nr:hypothetical protein [Candidatus Heimdallarchaeota archaeon]